MTSVLFGIGTPVQRPGLASWPNPARFVGWGALGMVLLAVAGVTVASLDAPPSTPIVDSDRATPEQATPAPTASGSTSISAGSTDAIEQAIAQAEPGTALAVLAELNVRQRGPSTDYARSRFGSPLGDTDGNGCDQRNDILRRDLTRKTLKAGTNGCQVMTGTLSDPYTGQEILFNRMESGSTGVRIDHVVSLGDAWRKGARTWTSAKRAEFATDPLNLLAVGSNAATAKRGADALGWLPEATEYWCAYVARQVAVKQNYGLWVTAVERTTIARILTGCKSSAAEHQSDYPLEIVDRSD